MIQKLHNFYITKKPSIYNTENILKFLYCIIFVFSSTYSLYISFMINLLVIIRQNKGFIYNPQTSIQTLIQNEPLSNLIYSLILITHQYFNTFFSRFPLALFYFIGIMEFIKRNEAINQKFKSQESLQKIQILIQNQNQIKILKNKIEIMQLPMFIITFQLFSIVMYVFFLKNKFKFNQNCQTAWREVDSYIARWNLPGYQMVRNLIVKIGSY